MTPDTTVEQDLLGADAIADPYSYFGALRDEAPVVWNQRYRSWVITSYEHVNAAFRNTAFSSDRITPFIEGRLRMHEPSGALWATFQVLQDWLVFKDPPDHTRLRRLVHRAFTPRAVESIRLRADAIADELLDDVIGAGEIDLLSSYAYPLPAIVIAEMLGVPADDRDRFKLWSDQMSALVFGGMEDPERHERAAEGMGELVGYLRDLIRRYEAQPADNLISDLIRARDESDSLSESEVVATCTMLLFGGHETTTNLIANAVLALLQHPAELARLRQGDVPIRDAVEEFVRYDGPAKVVVRQIAEPVEFAGQLLATGDRVFLVPAAANRDPKVFVDPERLRLDRSPNPHLGYGVGIHYCLGAPLARLESSIAVQKVISRLPELELVTDDLDWHPILLTRGLKKLPVRFTPA